jgi:hypothetical protein
MLGSARESAVGRDCTGSSRAVRSASPISRPRLLRFPGPMCQAARNQVVQSIVWLRNIFWALDPTTMGSLAAASHYMWLYFFSLSLR